MTDERETLTYDLFGTASRELAEQVAADGYEPDLILSIARGGLFLAGALGYALDVKNLFTMNVEFYTGVDQRLDLPVVLPPTLDRVARRQWAGRALRRTTGGSVDHGKSIHRSVRRQT